MKCVSWPLLLVPSNPPPPLVSEASDWYWWVVVTLVVLFSSQPSFVVYLTPAECLENDCREKCRKNRERFERSRLTFRGKRRCFGVFACGCFPFRKQVRVVCGVFFAVRQAAHSALRGDHQAQVLAPAVVVGTHVGSLLPSSRNYLKLKKIIIVKIVYIKTVWIEKRSNSNFCFVC